MRFYRLSCSKRHLHPLARCLLYTTDIGLCISPWYFLILLPPVCQRRPSGFHCSPVIFYPVKYLRLSGGKSGENFRCSRCIPGNAARSPASFVWFLKLLLLVR